MKKPFYRFPMVYMSFERSKYNPMRLILGRYYTLNNNNPKFYSKLNIDTKDIKLQ